MSPAGFRGRMSRGIRAAAFGFTVELSVRRTARGHTAAAEAVDQRALARLCEEFPSLAGLLERARGLGSESPRQQLERLYRLLPALHPPARETALRNELLAWREASDDAALRNLLDDAIARSSLRSGFLDTRFLDREPRDGEELGLQTALRGDLERFEKAYEAREGLLSSRDRWRPSVRGDLRGRCLIHYFEGRRQWLAGRRVLHVAPERELRAWFEEQAPALGLHYTTLDPFGGGVDLLRDLADTGLADAGLDLVICHRVLEHVVDEPAALREALRILAPGGFLSVSVPESMHRARAEEWWIPDRVHHHHVRQYGADFARRLESAGFHVRVERDLLDRSLDEHVRDGTYPMRLYAAFRSLPPPSAELS